MPYICLTRSDIPDGVLQVLDLVPNTSQRSDLDPPGQTKYVNRVVNNVPRFDGATPNAVTHEVEGLQAYVFDNVEAGGLSVETVTAEFTSVGVGDRIIVDGPGGAAVTFVAVVGVPTRTSFEFQVGLGTDILDADDFVATFNEGTTVQVAITASIGAGTAVTATNGGGTLDIVTLTAGARPSTPYLATTVAEDDGTPSTTTGGRIVLVSGDATTGQVINFGKLITEWTVAQLATAATALIARMDAGATAMSLVNINTDLASGAAGSELDSSGSSTSTGSVVDILRLMSGEVYRVTAGAVAGANGSFTAPNTVNDTEMIQGEWRPTAIGGDVEQVAIRPVRYTVNGSALTLSLLVGKLAQMKTAANILFPDAGLPLTESQPGPRTAQVNNARLVVVYDDDGTVL